MKNWWELLTGDDGVLVRSIPQAATEGLFRADRVNEP